MTVQELIDTALEQGDNVPPSDADYIPRRRRALNFVRELRDEVWWSGEHRWKRRVTGDPGAAADLVVPQGQGYVAVPTDFDDLGPYGDLYLVQGGIQQLPPLDEVEESLLQEYRTTQSPTTDPGIFSIFGQDATTFLDLIQIPYNPVAITLRLAYMKKPPTLRDAGDPDETPGAGLTADNAALQEIPERFHVTVLLNGLKAKLRESKGDARWQKYQADYSKALDKLKAQVARFNSENRRLPSFFGERR